MAKMTLDAIEQFASTQQNQNTVSFFGLKDDGEEAIVRFYVDSISDIDILTLHDVSVNGKYIRVSCNRESLNDNPNTCALCASGSKMSQKAFIKLLTYSNASSGGIVVKPCIWERGTNYAIKLREYLNNYGPLSDIICKVVRHGARGDLKTTYEIIPNLNKSIYPDTVYVKDFSAFNNYHVVGTLVKEKTNEEIESYLKTGQFPSNNDGLNGFPNVPQQQVNYNSTGFAPQQPSYTYANGFTPDATMQAQAQMPQQSVTSVPVQQVPQQQMPWQQVQQIQRPIRTY